MVLKFFPEKNFFWFPGNFFRPARPQRNYRVLPPSVAKIFFEAESSHVFWLNARFILSSSFQAKIKNKFQLSRIPRIQSHPQPFFSNVRLCFRSKRKKRKIRRNTRTIVCLTFSFFSSIFHIVFAGAAETHKLSDRLMMKNHFLKSLFISTPRAEQTNSRENESLMNLELCRGNAVEGRCGRRFQFISTL